MGPLDIITVADADRWLSAGLNLGDANEVKDMERLIKSAIAWVETYTSWRLYPRDEIIQNSKCHNSTGLYPINSITVKNQDAETITYKSYVQPTKTRIDCAFNSVITLNVGTTSPALIPQPLIDGCYKLITYLYENRDMYQSTLPTDVHMLINQYRRGII